MERGATVVAIGASPNLALLEVSRPGSLDQAPVVFMGGWMKPPAAGLPDDLLNFHYDPVTCAVALAWPGASVEAMRMQPVLEGGVVRFQQSDDGRATRVVVGVDGDAFAELWLDRVEAVGRGSDYRA